ncbi:protein kinase activating protein dpb11 [Coemansia spiralis]|uniref:Protein kinase activating protein dpb11 n=2 Tax=Coemansia TaxID=4863 RepID=A0A9W8G3C7_9FUNG|nr:protein kinase activating protein dpb11 [Coemansia umbellata]KAJ2620158.1 protein kinase activating protein dpb11 [Coemansia sp. RSA 1358]KAJ2669444.1 protein kinase activating protein dpb11 [Coemansia spiralis]
MTSAFPILRNFCISCSGLSVKEKESVYRRVEALGGNISLSLTTDVTHVVMRDSSLSSIKYKVAAKVGIPVVTLQFIFDCEVEARKLSRHSDLPQMDCAGGALAAKYMVYVDGYDSAAFVERIAERTRFLPFSGCHISTTGISGKLLEDIEHLITTSEPTTNSEYVKYASSNAVKDSDHSSMLKHVGGGGAYYSALTRRCTHLISAEHASQKFVFAKQWKIRIVTIAWFLDSVKTGFRQDEAKYDCKDDNELSYQRNGEYSSLHQTEKLALSADPEFPHIRVNDGYVSSSVQTLSLKSKPFSRNHTAVEIPDSDSIELPPGLSGSLETDSDDDLGLRLNNNHKSAVLRDHIPASFHRRLSVMKSDSADCARQNIPPSIPYNLSNVQPVPVDLCNSGLKRSYSSRRQSNNQLDDLDTDDFKFSALLNDGFKGLKQMLETNGDAQSFNWFTENKRPRLSFTHGIQRTNTSPGVLEPHRPKKICNHIIHNDASKNNARCKSPPIAHLISSSPKLQLSALSEDPVQIQLDIPYEAQDANIDKSVCITGISTIDGSTKRNGFFANCAFTSFGFATKQLSILQDIVSTNGGLYNNLFTYTPKTDTTNKEAIYTAISAFARHYADEESFLNLYLVIPLCGSKELELCISAVQSTKPTVHIVTECWVEQCLQDSKLYPDYREIEQQPHPYLYPGLSIGQHIMFKPLSICKSENSRSIILSISGYEGLERDHIGKLAVLLGMEFSERLSRKATHLICRPPFRGLKYERALKWGISIVDSVWIYELAAASVKAKASTFRAIHTDGKCSGNSNQIKCTGSTGWPSLQQKVAVPQQQTHKSPDQKNNQHMCIGSVKLAVTPLAQLRQQKPEDTPGRTPIDISLERNLKQAEKNHGKDRRLATKPSNNSNIRAKTPTDFNQTKGCFDDDETQLSPTNINRIAESGSMEDMKAFGKVSKEPVVPLHILDDVVIAISSRLYHRRNELTSLALRLGCRVLPRLDAKQATHLVHQSSREHETLRDYRIALQHNIDVVSPWWLYACRDTDTRIDEAEFPYTFHPDRRLRLVSNLPVKETIYIEALTNQKEKQSQRCSSRADAQQSNKPHSLDVAQLTADSKHSIRDKEASNITKEPITQTPVSGDSTVAIDDLIGKKTRRARRRYRQAPSGSSASLSIENGVVEPVHERWQYNTDESIQYICPPRIPNALEKRIDDNESSDSSRGAELSKHIYMASNMKSLALAHVNTSGGSLACRQRMQQQNMSETPNKRWWLEIEHSANVDHESAQLNGLISQEAGNVGNSALDSMPNTGAVDCLQSTENYQSKISKAHFTQATDKDSSVISLNSDSGKPGLQITSTDKDSLTSTSQENSTAIVQPAKSMPLNPPGVRSRTTIVYSEDADTVSERDRLIQRLIGK